ncbi:MAG TPA: histidine kinase [Candidatus Elarobacter sp.]|jgi:signal transduction histidine kinase|nr:histidine kinase [Candidatus Elarobacter sp.]
MPPALDPMPQARRTDRMLLLVFGTGTAIGLQLGFLHVFLWRTWTAPIAFLVPSLGYSAVVYALWRWVFPRLGARTLLAEITLQALVSLVTFAVLSALTTELIATLRGAPSLFGAPGGVEKHITATPEQQQMLVRLYAFAPVIPTVLLALIGYHQYWHRVLGLRHREQELVELAATAQLAALRAQINPHFLFNSLNSIAQLIRADPDRAEACVERLAEMFRYVLRYGEKDFVPLAEELEMARAYLDIERARFGDRLRVETHVDPPSLQHLIPNLILQPLVENAVRHGLSRKRGGGTVRIDARLADGCLELSVGDDGLGMPDTALERVYEHGIGLRNLRDRLERLYGPAHLPQITSAPGSGTRVRLRLPVRPAEAAA